MGIHDQLRDEIDRATGERELTKVNILLLAAMLSAAFGPAPRLRVTPQCRAAILPFPARMPPANIP